MATMIQTVELIGAPTDIGASVRGAGMGPDALRVADLQRLRVPMKKVLPFVSLLDHHPRKRLDDPVRLRAQLVPRPRQPGLFD